MDMYIKGPIYVSLLVRLLTQFYIHIHEWICIYGIILSTWSLYKQYGKNFSEYIFYGLSSACEHAAFYLYCTIILPTPTLCRTHEPPPWPTPANHQGAAGANLLL